MGNRHICQADKSKCKLLYNQCKKWMFQVWEWLLIMNSSKMQERLHTLPVLKIMTNGPMKSEVKAQKIFLDFYQLSQNTMQHNEIMKLRQFLALWKVHITTWTKREAKKAEKAVLLQLINITTNSISTTRWSTLDTQLNLNV